MRTATYNVDVASDRRRRENVPGHILCSSPGQLPCAALFPCYRKIMQGRKKNATVGQCEGRAAKILREKGAGTRNILERELARLGYSAESFADCACISSFKLIKELIRAGCRVSFLYEAVVKDDGAFGHFSRPPLTGKHELNVVYRQ